MGLNFLASRETPSLKELARQARTEGHHLNETTLKSYFEEVREKPFEVVLKPRSVFSALRHALEFDTGGCSQKNLTLAAILIRLGFKDIKFISVPFRWVHQTQRYPVELKSLAEQVPTTDHTVLSVKVPWQTENIQLDATWDRFMREELGFPNSQSLGVIPLNENRQTFMSLDDLNQHLRACEQQRTPDELEISRSFYEALNKWIVEERSK